MMDQEISIVQFRRWLLTYAERVIENEDHLTELDTAIGDADHGVNMRRGMGKLQERLQGGDAIRRHRRLSALCRHDTD